MPTTSPSKIETSRGSSVPRRAEVGRLQHRGGRAVDLPVGGGLGQLLELGEFAAEHLGNERTAGEVAREGLSDEFAVAQDGDAVGDLEHLVEEVGDEEDGDAAIAQIAHDAEQLFDLAAIEARGGLVEDEHAGVDDHGAADGDELLDRDRVAREGRAGVDVEAEVSEVTGGFGVGCCPVDAESAHLVAEHDVLADRQVLAEVDLLVDGRDAGRLGIGGGREGARNPVDEDRPGVDRVDAGQRLDERRLAGAVLAHERVHLAGAEEEVDVVEGEDAGESNRDSRHGDDRRDVGVRSHGVVPQLSGERGRSPPGPGVPGPGGLATTSG